LTKRWLPEGPLSPVPPARGRRTERPSSDLTRPIKPARR
jgi:hypothetical protein